MTLIDHLPDLPAEMTEKVFVSYSRADEEFAAALSDKLRRAGYDLWRDRSEMEGGEGWWQQIADAIRGSHTLILCLSPKALESPVVADEWRLARRENTRVIPVIAAEVNFASVPRWMKKRHWHDFRAEASEAETQWRAFIKTLNSLVDQENVPFTVPNLPKHFVERPQKFEAIIRHLLDVERANPVALTTALQGGGGFGKTTLAIAICHEDAVREAFDDGVLFITLGESPDLLNLLNGQIRIMGGEGTYTDANLAAKRFGELLEQKDMLIVLDDVWHTHHVNYFNQTEDKKRQAAYLITTRQQEVVARARAERIMVDEMETDEAAELLVKWLDTLPSDRRGLRKLAERLGEWALLLELVGAELRQLVELDGLPLEDALADINERLMTEGFTFLDRADEGQRNAALSLSLGISLKRLGEDERRFYMLGIFPEDTDIPFSATATLWGLMEAESLKMLRAMQRLSLFTRYDANAKTFRLHDVIRQIIVKQVDNPIVLHQHLIDGWGNLRALPDDYAWRNLAYHLREADQLPTLRELLLDYAYLQAKLNATDPNALLADCAYLPDDETVRLIQSAISMSAHVLNEDKEALAHQLVGRLMLHRRKNTAIQAFTDWIMAETAGLYPAFPDSPYTVLNPAGGMMLATLAGHTDRVRGAIELSDGCLLSWSSGKTLRLWGIDGQPLAALAGHTDRVRGAIELSDGRLLSWSSDSTLRLWDRAGQSLAVLEGRNGVEGAIELSDGRLLSWSEYDDFTSLRLWDRDGQPLTVFQGYIHRVIGVIELSNGRLLSWSSDSTLRLWDSTGQPLAVLAEHTISVEGAIELSDGRLLSWSDDHTLRLWTGDGQYLVALEGHTSSVSGAIELADGRLLSWSRDETLRLWDRDGQPLAILEGHTFSVSGAIELSDGRLLSWSFDETLRLWDGADQPPAILEGHTRSVKGAIALADGRLLSWSSDSTLRLRDSTGQPLAVLEGHTSSVSGAIELADGRLLSWSFDETLRLWDGAGQPPTISKVHTRSVEGAIALADGRLLSWSSDSTLRLWNRDGQPLTVLGEHTDYVEDVGAIALADGRLLSWSSVTNLNRDSTLRLWDGAGQSLAILEGHTSSVRGAIELADGRLLAWSWNNTMWLWSSAGQLLAVLDDHTWSIREAMELSNGRLLSWSSDSTLRLWDSTGQPLAALEGHTSSVEGAIALADGRLLSWSDDHTLRLWDGDGQPLAVLEDYDVWNPDHERVLAWGRSVGADLHPLFAEDLRITAGVVGKNGERLSLYDPENGRLLASFWADGFLTQPVVLADGETIVAGDEAGRVLFLCWSGGG